MIPIQQMVRRSIPTLFTVILLLFLPICVGAEVPKAEALFQKLLQSSQTVDFAGKLTFISQIPEDNPMREALVIRKAPDKQLIEFIWPLEIRGTGMVISGKERWPIIRDKGSRRRQHFMPPPPSKMIEEFSLKNVQLLLQNYDVRVLDGGHIAGRSTYLLEIEPKVTGKPSIKTWMDVEMGTILKIEQYDPQKRLWGGFAYSEIKFNPKIDEAVFRSRNKVRDVGKPPGKWNREELWNYDQGKPDLDKIRKEVQLNVILPEQAPAGFVLQSIQAVKFGEQKNVHLRYTDGLTVLSFFQSLSDKGGRGKRPEDKPPWQHGSVERMNIDGVECEVISGGPMLVFRWNYKGVYSTLIGELSQTEMTKIVRSFVSKGE